MAETKKRRGRPYKNGVSRQPRSAYYKPKLPPEERAAICARNGFTKEQWDTPDGRALQAARAETANNIRKSDPWRMAPWGVPHGMKKAEAIPLWRAAHSLADQYLEYMKKTDQAPSDMDVTVVERPNILPHTAPVVPESDEEKAGIALREAFLLAVGPTAIPEKLKAINTVLTYTRPKPESSTKLRVEKAEDFLDLIAEVRSPDDSEAD